MHVSALDCTPHAQLAMESSNKADLGPSRNQVGAAQDTFVGEHDAKVQQQNWV